MPGMVPGGIMLGGYASGIICGAACHGCCPYGMAIPGAGGFMGACMGMPGGIKFGVTGVATTGAGFAYKFGAGATGVGVAGVLGAGAEGQSDAPAVDDGGAAGPHGEAGAAGVEFALEGAVLLVGAGDCFVSRETVGAGLLGADDLRGELLAAGELGGNALGVLVGEVGAVGGIHGVGMGAGPADFVGVETGAGAGVELGGGV